MLYLVMYLGSVIPSDMFVEVLNERNTILTAIFMPHEPHPYMSLIIQRQTPLCYLMAICKRAYCVRGFTGRCLPPTSIVLGKSSKIMKLHDKVICNSHKVWKLFKPQASVTVIQIKCSLRNFQISEIHTSRLNEKHT